MAVPLPTSESVRQSVGERLNPVSLATKEMSFALDPFVVPKGIPIRHQDEPNRHFVRVIQHVELLVVVIKKFVFHIAYSFFCVLHGGFQDDAHCLACCRSVPGGVLVVNLLGQPPHLRNPPGQMFDEDACGQGITITGFKKPLKAGNYMVDSRILMVKLLGQGWIPFDGGSPKAGKSGFDRYEMGCAGAKSPPLAPLETLLQ